VSHSEFDLNWSPGFGGAIYVDQSDLFGYFYNIVIDSCYFSYNAALQGGAIYVATAATIANSSFVGNMASSGSEIYLNAASSGETSVIRCTFQGNFLVQLTAIFCASGRMNFEDSLFQNLTLVCNPFYSIDKIYTNLKLNKSESKPHIRIHVDLL